MLYFLCDFLERVRWLNAGLEHSRSNLAFKILNFIFGMLYWNRISITAEETANSLLFDNKN